MEKTNVMRMLDAAKIPYEVKEYEVDENDLSGIHVAEQLGQDPESVFKTLVLKGEKTGYLVCCIPVAEELDLKKAAKAAKEIYRADPELAAPENTRLSQLIKGLFETVDNGKIS